MVANTTGANGTNLSFQDEGYVTLLVSQAGQANWNPAPTCTNRFLVAKTPLTITITNVNEAPVITEGATTTLTTDEDTTGTVYFEPSEENEWRGGFKCHHGHCKTRNIIDLDYFVQRLLAGRAAA